MDALADRVIRKPVTAEAQWRPWLAEHVPALALDDVVRADQRLVVVAPHPDDEVLACGGVLALHAARGGESVVIAVTDGEASHAGYAGWTTARLADARRAESERGLARLGVPHSAVTRLGIPDGGIVQHEARVLEAVRSRLRASDVVVCTWRLDGHPDHDATGSACAKACATIGARFIEAPVWMWHWSRPFGPSVPWDRLRALPLSPTALARKAAALAEHVTQRTPRLRTDSGADGAVLDASILERAERRCEYFFV